MAIGFTANSSVGSLNSQLGVAAIGLRNAAQQALELYALTTSIGAGGLEAIGFASGDATSFVTAVNYLQTVAAVYYGTAAQTPEFNFDSALAATRAGQ
jgi:hypothetical protein